MTTTRIALANIRHPSDPEDSISLALGAIRQAAAGGALVVCFPECFVPGYRTKAKPGPAPDGAFLERAWSTIAGVAGESRIAVVLGTERLDGGNLLASTLVIGADGSRLGFQDKVQIDPSEEGTYVPGSGRTLFTVAPLTFGVVICHEGWRYPETVRWAVRGGAHLVFHPQFHQADGQSFRPTSFGDPANSFHEKAVLCRAAENTCFFASVNFASPGSPTTSAVADPNGSLIAYQPYGKEGLLMVDLDLSQATGLLARRFKPMEV